MKRGGMMEMPGGIMEDGVIYRMMMSSGDDEQRHRFVWKEFC
jgi:hypothetical protein